jgi:hypothetical protein
VRSGAFAPSSRAPIRHAVPELPSVRSFNNQPKLVPLFVTHCCTSAVKVAEENVRFPAPRELTNADAVAK